MVLDGFGKTLLEWSIAFLDMVAGALWFVLGWFLNLVVYLFINTPFPKDAADNPMLWVSPGTKSQLSPMWENAYDIMYGPDVLGIAIALLVLAFALNYLAPLLSVIPGVKTEGRLDRILFAFVFIIGWWTIGGYLLLFSDALANFISGGQNFTAIFQAINPFDTAAASCGGGPCPDNVGGKLDAGESQLPANAAGAQIAVTALLLIVLSVKATTLLGLAFFWLGRYVAILLLFVAMPVFIALWGFEGTGIPVLGEIGKKAIRLYVWIVFATLPSALFIRLGSIFVTFSGELSRRLASGLGSLPGGATDIITGIAVFMIIAAIPILAGFAPLYFFMTSNPLSNSVAVGAVSGVAGKAAGMSSMLQNDAEKSYRDRVTDRSGFAVGKGARYGGKVVGGAAAAGGAASAYVRNRGEDWAEDGEYEGPADSYGGGYQDDSPTVPQRYRQSNPYGNDNVGGVGGLPTPGLNASASGAGGAALVGAGAGAMSPNERTVWGSEDGRATVRQSGDTEGDVLGTDLTSASFLGGFERNKQKSLREGDDDTVFVTDEDGNEASISYSRDEDGRIIASVVKDGEVQRFAYNESDEAVNAYDALGVSEDASDQEIKAAYRKMASRYHPDEAVTDEEEELYPEMFKSINESYNVLTNDRDRYDRDGPEAYANNKRYGKKSLRGGVLGAGAGWAALNAKATSSSKSSNPPVKATSDSPKSSGSTTRSTTTGDKTGQKSTGNSSSDSRSTSTTREATESSGAASETGTSNTKSQSSPSGESTGRQPNSSPGRGTRSAASGATGQSDSEPSTSTSPSREGSAEAQWSTRKDFSTDNVKKDIFEDDEWVKVERPSDINENTDVYVRQEVSENWDPEDTSDVEYEDVTFVEWNEADVDENGELVGSPNEINIEHGGVKNEFKRTTDGSWKQSDLGVFGRFKRDVKKARDSDTWKDAKEERVNLKSGGENIENKARAMEPKDVKEIVKKGGALGISKVTRGYIDPKTRQMEIEQMSTQEAQAVLQEVNELNDAGLLSDEDADKLNEELKTKSMGTEDIDDALSKLESLYEQGLIKGSTYRKRLKELKKGR